MHVDHRKRWMHWANMGLLAAEGLAIGTAAGAVIGLFRLCLYSIAPALINWFSGWREHWWAMPLWLIALISAARILGWMVSRAPLISGSGIPQTELVITGRLHLSRRDWLKILPAKFLSCLISSLSGLSLGRTAPSVQMGAAAAALVSGLWERFSFSGHIHIAAGAAAGLAATFGAPAAGLLFAFEELHLRFTRGGAILIGFSVIAAELVIRFAFSFGPAFPCYTPGWPGLTFLAVILPFSAAIGAAGALYNKALLETKNAEALHTPLPQSWRILPPMLAAFALSFTFPAILGGGEGLINELCGLTEGHMLGPLLLLAIAKILFSLFSYTGNVPGGIIMPMLCIGALLGALCGQCLLDAGLIGAEDRHMLIICGMAGFFSASIRAPFTASALAAETTGGIACLPCAALAAFTAAWTADRLHSPPIYESMRAAIVVPKRR